MPAIIIPTLNSKTLKKPDKGDVFGMLWATKNIDLTTKPGSFLLTQRVGEVYSSADDADLEVPVAFIRTNADKTDRFWALGQKDGVDRTDGLLWKSTAIRPQTGWAQDAIANTPTDAVDNMVIFGSANSYDNLVVARDTDLAKLNNGTWDASWWDTTLAQTALSNKNTHHIHVFLNTLLVPDGNVVHTIDDSDVVVTNRLEFPDEYNIRWINNDGVYVYFGAEHRRGGKGLVFYWDGTSETYNGYSEVGAYTSLAGIPDENGVMHIVNSNGQLMKDNGVGFSEVAKFPWEGTFRPFSWMETDANLGDINTTIRPNGMAMIDGRISILMRSIPQSDWRAPENLPSGVWEYDKNIGLYMKNALSKYAGSTTHEYGTVALYRIGALYKYSDVDDLAQTSHPTREEFLAGAEIYTNGNTKIKAIIKSHQSGDNRGYFITSRIENGSDFKALWTRLQMAYRKFSSSSDKIVVKYKTTRDSGASDNDLDDYVFTGTWEGSTKISIDDADGSDLEVGDEVEVIAGVGEGQIFHISTITNTAGDAYDIIIDEAMLDLDALNTCKVRITKWNKLGEVDDQTTESKLMTIIKRSKWIQLKVELRGTNYSPQLEELFIEFNPSRR